MSARPFKWGNFKGTNWVFFFQKIFTMENFSETRYNDYNE